MNRAARVVGHHERLAALWAHRDPDDVVQVLPYTVTSVFDPAVADGGREPADRQPLPGEKRRGAAGYWLQCPPRQSRRRESPCRRPPRLQRSHACGAASLDELPFERSLVVGTWPQNPIQNTGFSDPDLTSTLQAGSTTRASTSRTTRSSRRRTAARPGTRARPTVTTATGRGWQAAAADQVFMNTDSLDGSGNGHQIFVSNDGGNTCSQTGIVGNATWPTARASAASGSSTTSSRRRASSSRRTSTARRDSASGSRREAGRRRGHAAHCHRQHVDARALARDLGRQGGNGLPRLGSGQPAAGHERRLLRRVSGPELDPDAPRISGRRGRSRSRSPGPATPASSGRGSRPPTPVRSRSSGTRRARAAGGQ